MKTISISRRHSHSVLTPALLAALLWLWTGCNPGAHVQRGFRLPDGNAEKGKAAFVKLQCTACHTIQGFDLPPPISKSPITVVLGGEVARVRNYGELVTSIINPSHILSEKYKKDLAETGKGSPMPEYNESITVAQLIDLVTFLQPHYKKLELEYVVMH